MQIDKSRLSEKQQGNFQRNLEAYENKSPVTAVAPSVLYLELTRNCFGQCVFCKKVAFNDPANNMDEALFERLLADYVSFAVLVDLRGWGESLLLPNFKKYIEKVSALGPKIRLTTTLGCGSEESLQSLIDHDVFISVSLDYATKDTYERMRRGLSFSTVMKNLKFVTERMKQKGTLKDNIRLGVAPLQKANLKEIAGIFKIAEQLGIPALYLSPLAAEKNDRALLSYHEKDTIKALKNAVVLSEKTGIRMHLLRCPFKKLYDKARSFDLCCHPWLYGLVTSDGNMLCCDHMLGHNTDAWGHISEGRDKVWNGAKAQQTRRAHAVLEKSALPEKCQACYGVGRYADHEHEIDPAFAKWLMDGPALKKKLSKTESILEKLAAGSLF